MEKAKSSVRRYARSRKGRRTYGLAECRAGGRRRFALREAPPLRGERCLLAPPPEFRPFTTREAALILLFDLIRRNADLEPHHLRILASLPNPRAAGIRAR
jgi:hypothetical protein